MGSGILTAIITILVFGGIILFHEFGHFITAKRCGVSVWEFSIGMGPSIYSWERGETLYSIRLLPIGGYVMLEGEEEEVESENSLSQKPLWQRLMVFAAGSVNNLLLGYILLVIITAMNGYVGTTYIAKFNEGATSNSVLQLGDKITHINGNRVRTSNDVTYEFLRDFDGNLDITVLRDGETMQFNAIPFKMEDIGDGVFAIDMDFKVAAIPPKPIQYLTYPINWSVSLGKQVWGSFVDLVSGRYNLNQLSGPVGVAEAIGQASRVGLKQLLMLSAFLTINIGIFNLIPFPLLDGGKIVIILLEALFRRKFNQRVIEWIMTGSVAMMIMLMIYVTCNDISRLIR